MATSSQFTPIAMAANGVLLNTAGGAVPTDGIVSVTDYRAQTGFFPLGSRDSGKYRGIDLMVYSTGADNSTAAICINALYGLDTRSFSASNQLFTYGLSLVVASNIACTFSTSTIASALLTQYGLASGTTHRLADTLVVTEGTYSSATLTGESIISVLTYNGSNTPAIVRIPYLADADAVIIDAVTASTATPVGVMVRGYGGAM